MHTVEYSDLSTDYPIVIIRTSMGHRCGYVGIPETHPLWDVDYNEPLPVSSSQITKKAHNNHLDKLPIISVLFYSSDDPLEPQFLFEAHGGLTYSGGTWPGILEAYPIYTKQPIWWYGFDTGHLHDNKLIGGQPFVYVLDECQRLREQLRDFPKLLGA